jgi:Uma2 family endonuclease
MPAHSTEWTVEMVRALPHDGNRYEVIDGELFVTPPPSVWHQSAVGELLVLVLPYVRAHRLGHAFVAPADVVYGPRKMVQPDLFVAPHAEGSLPNSWEEFGRPRLAVEIISRSTALTDRREKRELYQRKGVPEYWVIDVDARTVERWRPDDTVPEVFTGMLEWRPDAAEPPLVIDLVAFFARVTGVTNITSD